VSNQPKQSVNDVSYDRSEEHDKGLWKTLEKRSLTAKYFEYLAPQSE
jgi:hypothetical protein